MNTTATPETFKTLVAQNGASAVVTSATGLSYYDPNFNDGTSGKSNPSSYTCYSGPASSFPPKSQWMNFAAMFNLNQQDSLVPVGDSGPEQGAIYNAIVSVSKASKVDARVILAVIIQEVFPPIEPSKFFNVADAYTDGFDIHEVYR